MKWSIRVTCPNRSPADRRAYSAFFIECSETASVMVSTRPEVPPVMRIRKLKKQVRPKWAINKRERGILSHPTLAVLFFPNTPEFLNKLNSKLLLPEIGACLDDHR